ncbi:MAG TPA: hypothetical protein VGM98_24775, partial [Schlesneria sp.]
MKTRRLLLIVSLALILCSCCCQPEASDNSELSDKEQLHNEYMGHRRLERHQGALVERDIEIITFVLKQRSCGGCFLTVEPPFESGKTQEWKDIPEPLREALLKSSIKYKPASEAYFKFGAGGGVKEKMSDATATMRTIIIRRWISDSEVVIEDSRTSGALSGYGTLEV